jgi:hypothetical protein
MCCLEEQLQLLSLLLTAALSAVACPVIGFYSRMKEGEKRGREIEGGKGGRMEGGNRGRTEGRKERRRPEGRKGRKEGKSRKV